jgi:hypothetical protein
MTESQRRICPSVGRPDLSKKRLAAEASMPTESR